MAAINDYVNILHGVNWMGVGADLLKITSDERAVIDTVDGAQVRNSQ